MPASDGMPAGQLQVTWRKSTRGNPSGNCVEVAALPGGGPLPGGAAAARNPRHPFGPALVDSRDEISAFPAGVKDGEFDDLA
jgi:hypothetical protein